MLPIIQIIVAVLLIIAILFQQRGTALGAALGGDSGGYSSRRGLQKKLFFATVFLGTVFVILALINLL